MQRDTPKTEENVEKADRVVQTEATENEQEEHEKMDSISDDSEMEPIITKKPKNTFDFIVAKVRLKETHKVKRAELVLDIILQSDIVTIGEESSLIYINNDSTDIQVSPFLYDLQQPTKKIDQEAYSKILLFLQLTPDLVSNTYAKQIIEAYESEQEFFLSLQSSHTGRGIQEKASKENEKTNKKEAEQKKWSRFIF